MQAEIMETTAIFLGLGFSVCPANVIAPEGRGVPWITPDLLQGSMRAQLKSISLQTTKMDPECFFLWPART